MTSASQPKHTNSAEGRSERQRFASAWGPLHEPLFRALWIAAVASNVGTWMEDVGEAWLMTSLTTSTLLVARAAGEIKRRDGAFYWNLFRDTADPGRFVETFIVDSWAELLRQHGRLTKADREVEDRMTTFHIGASPPKISHLIAEP